MPRVALTELAITVSTDPQAPAFKLRWVLREIPAYPEPPGERPGVHVRETLETQLSLTAAELAALAGPAPDLTMFGARLFAPESAALVARAAAARGPDRWSRVTISVVVEPGDALEQLPWEALFASPGLVVLRRERSPASRQWAPRDRPRLGFPLKLWAVGRDRDLERGDLLDAYGAWAIQVGALAWCRGPEDAPDLLHLEGAPWVSGPVQPRVVIVHDPDARTASTTVTGHALRQFGAEAALHLTGPDRGDAIRTLYRKLLHDWPLDRCLGELREQHQLPPDAAILHCLPRGELSVSLSSVLAGALTPVESTQKASRDVPDSLTRGLDSLESSRGDGRGFPVSQVLRTGASSVRPDEDRLRGAWKAALQMPHEVLTRHARALSIEREASDLLDAVAIARDLAAVVPERAEVAQVLQAVDDADPAELVEASARVTQVRILDPATGEDVPSSSSLVVERPYRVHVQIVREAAAAAWAGERFPEEALRETLARLGTVELTVMLYPLGHGIQLSAERGTIRLRALGDSDPLAVELTLSRAGRFAIRVCVYHETALLQAVVVEGVAGDRDDLPGGVSRTLDFAASGDFMALDQLAHPDVTIWTNQTSDGTHWFGVFARDDEDRIALTRRRLASLSSDDLHTVATQLQTALGAVVQKPGPQTPEMRRTGQRPRAVYRFVPPVPADDAQRAERLDQLAALAVAGWDAYNGLFPELNPEDSPAASTAEALLSIARCRPERTNIAWAALYDYHLEDPRPQVCELFAAQLLAGQDLLDQPARCRAQAGCPLGDDQRRSKTVCPFGFWGVRHRIEQPPNHIAPAAEPASDAPVHAAAQLTTAIRRPARGAPRLGIAWWPHFDERVERHITSLDALGAPEVKSDRAEILALLARGQKQIYYFFCHGTGEHMTFALEVGPGRQGDRIKVSDLNDRRYTWSPDGPAPLVFLNGCDTTAFKGDTINKLIDRLKAMGASGVVGTEIPVHTYLAEDVGKRVIDELAAGHTLGRAFLTMRRALLRTQYNPLGLAYSFFGADRLHLCEGGECRICHRGAPVTA